MMMQTDFTWHYSARAQEFCLRVTKRVDDKRVMVFEAVGTAADCLDELEDAEYPDKDWRDGAAVQQGLRERQPAIAQLAMQEVKSLIEEEIGFAVDTDRERQNV